MFYTICQNNSGGNFNQDCNVDHLVCVEADNAKDATEKLENITDHYNQYSCPCCGDYFSVWLREGDGTDFISDGYGVDVLEGELRGFDVDYARYVVVHYKDGRVVKIDRLEKIETVIIEGLLK